MIRITEQEADRLLALLMFCICYPGLMDAIGLAQGWAL